MFDSAKNALASKAAQLYVNNLLARYGRLRELRIDTRTRTIDAVCELQGESEPLTLRVERYSVEERGGRRFLQLDSFSCSRPWVQRLLEDFVQGRAFELPPWAASAL